MGNISIPSVLIDALPDDVDLQRATITTAGELFDSSDDLVDASAIVVILPGYTADDGNAEVEFRGAESAEAAAQEYVNSGDWGDCKSTDWIDVCVWRVGYVMDKNNTPMMLELERACYTVTLKANEPDCKDGNHHDWQSPHEVLGGLKENPGVWGHGGGVKIHEVCANCGCYRITDTWAQNPRNGQQGLRSVEYKEPDVDSLGWVLSI